MTQHSGPTAHYDALWLEGAGAPLGLLVECSDPARLRLCLHRARYRLGTEGEVAVEMREFPPGHFGFSGPCLLISKSIPLKARRGRPPKARPDGAEGSHPDDDILGDLGL